MNLSILEPPGHSNPAADRVVMAARPGQAAAGLWADDDVRVAGLFSIWIDAQNRAEHPLTNGAEGVMVE